MRRQVSFSIATAISIGFLSAAMISSAPAQTSPEPGGPALASNVGPTAGTAGRVAKFLTTTTLGNSVIFEKSGLVGIGTANPASKLEIFGQNALQIRGFQPNLTFRDTNASNARHVIQSVGGGLNLLSEGYLKGTNPSGFVRVDNLGRVGIGAANPMRALQIGPSFDAAFTIEPSDASPRAGFIRFGDKTGWQLRIGRSRESSGGPLNTGLTGSLVTIVDNGAFHLNGFPLGPTGVQALCRTLSNAITMCPGSSLRYKTDIEPYQGGLEVINRLKPVAFTRKHSGKREIGLIAEDVETVEPFLTYRDDEGEIEGVKYDLLSTVLVNAVKEQQQQIQRQQATIEQLQTAVARLERMSQQLQPSGERARP